MFLTQGIGTNITSDCRCSSGPNFLRLFQPHQIYCGSGLHNINITGYTVWNIKTQEKWGEWFQRKIPTEQVKMIKLTLWLSVSYPLVTGQLNNLLCAVTVSFFTQSQNIVADIWSMKPFIVNQPSFPEVLFENSPSHDLSRDFVAFGNHIVTLKSASNFSTTY